MPHEQIKRNTQIYYPPLLPTILARRADAWWSHCKNKLQQMGSEQYHTCYPWPPLAVIVGMEWVELLDLGYLGELGCSCWHEGDWTFGDSISEQLKMYCKSGKQALLYHLLEAPVAIIIGVMWVEIADFHYVRWDVMCKGNWTSKLENILESCYKKVKIGSRHWRTSCSWPLLLFLTLGEWRRQLQDMIGRWAVAIGMKDMNIFT